MRKLIFLAATAALLAIGGKVGNGFELSAMGVEVGNAFEVAVTGDSWDHGNGIIKHSVDGQETSNGLVLPA